MPPRVYVAERDCLLFSVEAGHGRSLSGGIAFTIDADQVATYCASVRVACAAAALVNCFAAIGA
jgi:hypothetical protein